MTTSHEQAREDVLADLAAAEPIVDAEILPAPCPFEHGTLIAYADYANPPQFDDTTARLGLAEEPHFHEATGQWTYRLVYVQRPEDGEPGGGSSYPQEAARLRLPTSHAEIIAAARYRAAARVHAARAELATAEQERDAIELAARMLGRDGDR